MRRFVCLTVSCLALAACSESNPASDVSGAAQGDESPSPETGSEIAEPPPPPRADEDLSDVMDDVLDVASPPAMDMDALTEEPEDAVTATEPEDAVTPTEPEDGPISGGAGQGGSPGPGPCAHGGGRRRWWDRWGAWHRWQWGGRPGNQRHEWEWPRRRGKSQPDHVRHGG